MAPARRNSYILEMVPALMPGRPSVLALCALVLAAGCIGPSADDEVARSAVGPLDELLPGLPTPAELAARSLDTPPAWRLGEWWRFEVSDRLTKGTYEATVVVATGAHGRALLGMPEEAFDDAAIVIHLPPTGPIRLEDHAWHFHADMFPMAPFPLVAGKTWSFGWLGDEMVAEVVAVEEGRARMEGLSPQTRFTWTYDAATGFVTEFEWGGLVSYRVVDHGFGFAGRVLAPDDPMLAIFTARFAGVVDPFAGMRPGPPITTVEVPEGYDTMSLGFILGSVGLPGTGAYRAVATAPDGTRYERMLLPNQAPAIIEADRVTSPSGVWRLEMEAIGTGAAVIEGVAFRSVLVELPAAV